MGYGACFVLSKFVRTVIFGTYNTQGVLLRTLMLSATSLQNTDVSSFGTIWFEKKSVKFRDLFKLDLSTENS